MLVQNGAAINQMVQNHPLKAKQEPCILLKLYPDHNPHSAIVTYNIPMAWYLVLMVVGWWRTKMSPSNSQQATGFRLG